VKNQYITSDTILTNPADPQHRRYTLHPWTSEQIVTLQKTNPSTTPIAYEAVDNDTTPVCIAYLDGHIEVVKSRKDLNTQIAAAEAALKK
jgi:hypothetical protein